MRRGALAATVCVAAGWWIAPAGPIEERFEAANRAYEQGEFARAEAEYRAILAYGIRAPEVYYNLGNTCFRQQRLGQAILSYERALRANPADPDARHNLEFCRQQIVDREAAPGHWMLSAYQAWTRAVGADGEAWILLAVYLPGMAGLGVWIAARPEPARRLARFTAVSLLALTVPAASLVALRMSREAAEVAAIVLVDKVEGRSGPGEDHAVLFTVHEGLKVQVRNQAGEWVQVLLPNGLNGWLPGAAVEGV